MKRIVPAPLAVSVENAGLGNRIKSWVSAMRIGAESRVLWPVTPNMPASFAELFSNDCEVSAVPAGAVAYHSWRLAILPQDEPFLPAGFAVAGGGGSPFARGLGKAWWTLTGRRTDRYRYMLFPKTFSKNITRADGRVIDLEYDRIPQYFRDAYTEAFARVRAQPAIARLVDEWATANLTAETIGVQVRTWRDSPHRHKKYHKPALQRLARLLDGADPAARFFVVSDSDEVAPDLAKRYGANRVLQYPRRTARLGSWRSSEGLVEDWVDMLLLARTQQLFASYLSTFSEAAWWLGGAKARVAVF